MPKLQYSKNKEGKGGRWSITVPLEMVQAKHWDAREEKPTLLLNFNADGNIEISELKALQSKVTDIGGQPVLYTDKKSLE